MTDTYKHYISGTENPKLTYTSQIGTHSIILEIDTKRREALVNTMDIKLESPVELTLLLKKISCDLKEKKIDRIIQQVSENEWIELKRQGIFKYINENTRFKFINIYSETELFPEAVMKGIGFVDI